ncbi:ankyrin repeat domain-containing protein [Demequina sp.]|uniref:ankyrin repeat domain-containing protein n=1 Tax=Demequina sp. TaxID=2050685 RepID=UPI003D108FE3
MRRGLPAAFAALIAAAVTLAGCTDADELQGTPQPSVSHTPQVTVTASDLEDELMEAVRAGDMGAVTAILNAGQDPNYWLDDATPLSRAIVANNIEMAQLLLDAGALVETDEWSHTTVAAQYGDAEMMRFILDHGGTTTGSVNYRGWPLATAAYAGNLDTVKVLLSLSADPNVIVTDEHGDFPILVYGVNGGSPEVVQALVEAGADPYLQGSDGKTAIDAAKAPGREQIADYLGTVVPAA